MKPISHADLVALLRPHDPPCVSLHVPVDGREGAGPAAVKLANAARAVRPKLEAWAKGDPARAAAAERTATLMDEMVAHLSDARWGTPDGAWAAATRGLALFVSPGYSAIHRLNASPAEFQACDTAFHARPVLDQHGADQRFHLLTLHRDEVRLFEGTAERLDTLPLGDIPASMIHAVGGAWDDSQHGRGFHGSPAAGKGRGNAAAVGVHMHGYSGNDADEEKDTQRFLQRVGHALPRGMGEAGGVPFVLMAVDKKLGMFRKLQPNVVLAEGGVAVDPHRLTPEELHAKAWAALEPVRKRRVADALEAVEAALPRGRASKDLQVIAKAAVTGRVATLLLAHGKHDAGRMDPVTGELSLDGPGHHGPDTLEQIASAVLLNRGELVVAPHDAVRSHAGAIFRY